MPRMPKPSPQARSPPDWYATRHLDLGRNPLGTKLIEFKGHIGARRLLDLSRCGHNNTGLPIALARADALARGIVINGLVILIRPSNSTVQNPVIVGPARMPLFEKASTTQRTFPLTFSAPRHAFTAARVRALSTSTRNNEKCQRQELQPAAVPHELLP